MIKLIYRVTLLILIVVPALGAAAQKTPFTGTIIYDVTTDGQISRETREIMPKSMVYRYSGEKQSLSLNFAMAEQRTIFDLNSNTARVLMNLMGKKIVIVQSAAELEQLRKKEGETIGVQETGETKSIAGYPCKKVIITKKNRNGDKIPSTLYYTDALDISNFKEFSAFPEIKGTPLEFSMKSGEMEFTVRARSVKKENILPSEFVISPDYQQFSVEELQKLFGSLNKK